MSSFVRLFLAAALAATALVATTGTAGASENALYPESLIAGDPPFPGTTFTFTDVDCTAPGTGSFSFEAHGDAVTPPSLPPGSAPYPGTFDETGTATIENGVFTSFHADFTIQSSNGTVTGSKDLLVSHAGTAICEPGAPTAGGVGGQTFVTYTANTPNGVDTGCATVLIGNRPSGIPGAGDPSSTGAMAEFFDQSCPPAPPVTGTVTGSVTDQNGDPFPFGSSGAAACPGPTVSADCPGQVIAPADADGDYSLTLTTGEWTIVGFAVVNGQLYTSQPTTVDVDGGETEIADFTIFVPSALEGGGSFVIGDEDAAVGAPVTFWSAQWARENDLSGGSAPPTFKGFASNGSNPPACGEEWTAEPGTAGSPPEEVPEYMAVAVTSSTEQSGSTVTGDTTRVVVVRTDPGYDDNPGHEGTGTVVAVLCEG